MSKFVRARLWAAFVLLSCLVLLAAACTSGAPATRRAETPRTDQGEASGEASGKTDGDYESLAEFARNGPRQVPALVIREKFGESGEAERLGGPAAQAYEDRALPRTYISYKRSQGALQAAGSIPSARSNGSLAPITDAWSELGPVTPAVPAISTYTDRATTNSGRVTALAIAPTCVPGDCVLFVAAAGGGVWRTADALADAPTWTPLDSGLTTNSFGSLAIDPNVADGSTIYAGSGEPNGSGDSEAGVGLFKSTNGGTTWTIVPGSVAVARDRSIASIAIDPADPNHYYIGTAVARHGSSGTNGGRRTPPNAPALGLYETTDGGASFNLIFSKPPSVYPPASGIDWFQGGVNNIQLDPNDPATVYAAVLGYGLFRQSRSLDGDATFHKVFKTFNKVDTYGDRSEYDLADMGDGTTRIYLGDSSDDLGYSAVFRTDDASVPANQLMSHHENSGWIALSSPVTGTPGFGSYRFCGYQCGYDMFVASPPGQPDTVWIGGQMHYNELTVFGGSGRSNGRAVMRSTDAGATFTDMTNDARSQSLGMHPDQHAIVFSAQDPEVAITGSDGGVIRTSGEYTDDSARCASRPIGKPKSLVNCQLWLSSVPTVLTSLNDGLATIQFQSVSANPQDPTGELMGGTQDNGTWLFSGSPTWLEVIDGDGGLSGFDAVNDQVRFHTYYDAQIDVSFRGGAPGTWNWVSDPFYSQTSENRSFYVPIINDPVVGGSIFVGLQHVWRTQDSGGPQAFLESNCNEYTGTFEQPCGDWVPLGGDKSGRLTSSFFGDDKRGQYVVTVERTSSDTGTLWAGTRIGRVFVSTNADAAASDVRYARIDTSDQPERFVSGIEVDPADPNHAFVSFSGYEAYTPGQPGHVFDVEFDPGTGTATWTDISDNIGDQPVTDVAFDSTTGDLYASTDFAILRLAAGTNTWVTAANGLPPVATYALAIAPGARVLYAATHGRGAWALTLP
jgi:hypothetical protein